MWQKAWHGQRARDAASGAILGAERAPQAQVAAGIGQQTPTSRSLPMQAIKAKCRECVGSMEEAKRCWATPGNAAVCELHRFITAGMQGKRTWAGALKAIRRECLLCMGGSAAGVAECPSGGCALWSLRFGIMPATAAARGLRVEADRQAGQWLAAMAPKSSGPGCRAAWVPSGGRVPTAAPESGPRPHPFLPGYPGYIRLGRREGHGLCRGAPCRHDPAQTPRYPLTGDDVLRSR